MVKEIFMSKAKSMKKIISKILLILKITAFSIMVGVVILFIVYPIYDGIRYWVFVAPKITGGAWDVPSLNAARGRCDHMYHIEKIPFSKLPDWCQDYKIEYKNYKPVGIIPQ